MVSKNIYKNDENIHCWKYRHYIRRKVLKLPKWTVESRVDYFIAFVKSIYSDFDTQIKFIHPRVTSKQANLITLEQLSVPYA